MNIELCNIELRNRITSSSYHLKNENILLLEEKIKMYSKLKNDCKLQMEPTIERIKKHNLTKQDVLNEAISEYKNE
jgi:hypothetical protein